MPLTLVSASVLWDSVPRNFLQDYFGKIPVEHVFLSLVLQFTTDNHHSIVTFYLSLRLLK